MLSEPTGTLGSLPLLSCAGADDSLWRNPLRTGKRREGRGLGNLGLRAGKKTPLPHSICEVNGIDVKRDSPTALASSKMSGGARARFPRAGGQYQREDAPKGACD